MRILHVTPAIAKSEGGPSEVVRGLVPVLQDAGHEVHVLSTTKGISVADEDILHESWLSLFNHAGPASLTYSRTLGVAARSRVREFDVVHVHGLQSHVGSSAMEAARRSETAYVLEPHGALDDYHRAQHKVRKAIYRTAFDRSNYRKMAGVLSSSELEYAGARSAFPEVVHAVVPLGVDAGLLSQPMRQSSPGAMTVCFIGRITRKKRVDIVLDVMSRPEIRVRNINLIIAGAQDGSLGFDLNNRIREDGLHGSVTYLGPVDRSTRADILSRADLFILPSEDESFGVAVAEAMAAGVPVLTTDRVGLAPAAADAGALMIAPRTVDAFLRRMLEVLDDPSAANRMRLRARAHAERDYSWFRAGDRIQQFYNDVLSGR